MENPEQENQQPSQPPPMHAFPPASKGIKPLTIIIIVAALLVAGGALAYLHFENVKTDQQASSDLQIPTVPNSDNQVVVTHNPYQQPNGNQLQPRDPNYPTTTPTTPTSTPAENGTNVITLTDPLKVNECKNLGSVVPSKSGQIQWTNLQLLPELQFLFATDTNAGILDEGTYLVGHFLTGPYQGGDLLMWTVDYDGLSIAPSVNYVVKQGNHFTALTKYDKQLPDPSYVKYLIPLSQDSDFQIQDFSSIPTTIHSANPPADFSQVSSFTFYAGSQSAFCEDDYVKAFTDPNAGEVFTDNPQSNPQNQRSWNGFYTKSPDGTVETYELSISFTNDKNVPLVTWNNGKKNINEYSYQAVGGCGSSEFLDVVQDVHLSDLVQIGTTFDGQVIYGYKDSNAEELKTMYGEIYTPDGQTQPTYAKFLADNPIFFWQDPFGELVRFKITKYQPLAECAKPVIYLYPEKTEKISVGLIPAGGFTYTEPSYNNGWNVIADPLSNITNLADGQQYPYLFWEGRGGMYQTPTKGFVVAQAGVHQLLEDKLSAAGLNEKERSDFEQFWEPKMQSAPYYFVTFMGNDVMDNIAPLSILPKPDTVIRVLMDFTPLERPISVEGYNIRTPVRKGFTVVEWGGVLRQN